MALENRHIITDKVKRHKMAIAPLVARLFLASILSFLFSDHIYSQTPKNPSEQTKVSTKAATPQKAKPKKSTKTSTEKQPNKSVLAAATDSTPLASNASNPAQTSCEFPATINYQERLAMQEAGKIISAIHVSGNVMISKESIINRSPLKIGDKLDINATATIIKNLYSLGYFHQIKIYGQDTDDKHVALYIVVEEKPRIQEICFKGNKALTEKELKEAINADKLTTLAKEELKALIVKLKKLYRKKNYHHSTITAALSDTDDGRVSALFTIKEGKKSYLNRISFKGNKQIPSKKLKRIIFSKEDWILGIIDNSGVYNPEMSEGDKYMIEEIYKNNGFIHAKVVDTAVQHDANTGNYHVTYTIQEGDRYWIKSINTKGNDIISDQRLKASTFLQEGQIYSLEGIRTALENMRLIWGEHGYIFADIEPSIDVDEETKSVSLSFEADLKDQVYLNRLTIRGNKKTKDSVIRRQIWLDEGELITNLKMDRSKSSVSMLNYFEAKNGVNWKTIRLDDTHADLDLVVNEIKTGHFNINLNFGGAPAQSQSPQTGLNVGCCFGDRNILGSGIAVDTAVDLSQNHRSVRASAMNPWMFDRPINGTAVFNARSSEYNDQIENAEYPPYERVIGGDLGLGYACKLLGGVRVEGHLLIETIDFTKRVMAAQRLQANDRRIAQFILDKQFQTGNEIGFLIELGQEKRNGSMFPTQGHQWNWCNKLTIPGFKVSKLTDETGAPIRPGRFNFFKSDFDISWYTPLINEHDLVLCVHGRLGLIIPFKDKDIPWKELYHMGGPDTIRGYTYGQVGPTWKHDSIGATKSMCVNVEFIMPLTSDLGTRAVIFYDGGAGWDSPDSALFAQKSAAAGLSFEKDFANNKFVYRHTVGIGIRIKSPTPLQIDFGIKLNPSKRFKKELTQMHLNMEHSF